LETEVAKTSQIQVRRADEKQDASSDSSLESKQGGPQGPFFVKRFVQKGFTLIEFIGILARARSCRLPSATTSS
jgi:hypothetical protein